MEKISSFKVPKTSYDSYHDASRKSTLDFLREFIHNHPQMKLVEQMEIVKKFSSAYNTKLALEKEAIKIARQIATAVPGIASYNLTKELLDIQDILDNDPALAQIDALRNKIINHNLKLVVTVASKYQNHGLEFEELFQEGILGFVRAIEKYNPDHDVKISSYAVWWIRQKITRTLSNKARLIRLPVHIASQVTKVLATMSKHRLSAESKNWDTIAEHANLSRKQVEAAVSHIFSFWPINFVPSQSLSDHDSSSDENVQDSWVDENIFDEDSIEKRLTQDLALTHFHNHFMNLSDVQRFCISNRLGLGNRSPTYLSHIANDGLTAPGKNNLHQVKDSIKQGYLTFLRSALKE